MSSPKTPRAARAKKPSTPVEVAADTPDPVSEGVRGLMALFTEELAEVRFPDVDGEVLGSAAETVREANAEVNRLFAELEAAQVKLADEKLALGKLAERGAAYVRIFAADNEALVEKLDGLDLGGAKRAGRKTKAKASAKAVVRPRYPEKDAAEVKETAEEPKKSA